MAIVPKVGLAKSRHPKAFEMVAPDAAFVSEVNDQVAVVAVVRAVGVVETPQRFVEGVAGVPRSI